MVFLFDTMEAADDFVDLFDDTKYKGDPSVVEENTKLIETTYRATGINPKVCDRLEARLLLGQEVMKIN